MLVIFVFLKIPDQPTAKAPLSEKVKQLDIPGTTLLVPGIVCLLLALQLGGQNYPVSLLTNYIFDSSLTIDSGVTDVLSRC